MWTALTNTPRDEVERQLVERVLPAVGRGLHKDYEWVEQGILRIDYSRVSTQLRALKHHQATLNGNLDERALLQSQATGDDILLNAQGTEVTARNYPGVVQSGDSIGDVVEVTWNHTGKIQFRPNRLGWPLAPTEARMT